MEGTMEAFAEELKIIAEACLNDERILEIVKNISNMSEEERIDFKSKVLKYFMKKNSPEDMEAYNFYKIILTENNAKKVVDIYYNFLGKK
ncbi:MAG: hypothetical protein ABDH59_00620 [Fervidobacterium sp.]